MYKKARQVRIGGLSYVYVVIKLSNESDKSSNIK